VYISSVIAAGSNNAFAINGFGGLTNPEIVSFFITFVIFNFYVVLMAASLAAFFVTAKSRHGRIRTAAVWHFVAAIWVMLAFISTVWGAPAEKAFTDVTGHNLSLNQAANITLGGLSLGRAGMLFVGFFFALIAILCMLIGLVRGAQQRRQIREQAFAY
jgi:hypothetical protein